MIQKQLSLLILSCLITLPALGQKAMTFQECVTEAATHNLDLLTAEQTVKADEASHTASLGQFFPQISFNASINRSGPGGLTDTFNNPDFGQNSSLSLNATQNIFSGFKDFAAVDEANAQLDLARAQLAQAKAQVSHDLKNDFYQLLYSQKQINLLKTIVQRQKANMDLVEMNFKGGTDNKGSFLQAQADYQEAIFEVDQAQRSLRVSQKQLDQVLGRSPMEKIEVQGNFETPALPGGTPDFAQLTVGSPAHLQAVAQLHMSEGQDTTARGALLPTLSANASLFRSGWNFDEGQPGWSAGLELSMPLFTGGKDLFNWIAAGETLQATRDSLQSQDLKTESLLESGYASFANAIEQIHVLESQLKAVQTQEEIAKAEYLNGLLIFVNWNQIEDNLTNQQKAELSGLLSEKTAEANWELAQGKGVIP